MAFPQTHVDGEVWDGAAVTDLEARAAAAAALKGSANTYTAQQTFQGPSNVSAVLHEFQHQSGTVVGQIGYAGLGGLFLSARDTGGTEYAKLDSKAFYLGEALPRPESGEAGLVELRFRTDSGDSGSTDDANWLVGPDYQGEDFVLLGRIHPDNTGDDFLYIRRGTIGSEMPRFSVGAAYPTGTADPNPAVIQAMAFDESPDFANYGSYQLPLGTGDAYAHYATTNAKRWWVDYDGNMGGNDSTTGGLVISTRTDIEAKLYVKEGTNEIVSLGQAGGTNMSGLRWDSGRNLYDDTSNTRIRVGGAGFQVDGYSLFSHDVVMGGSAHYLQWLHASNQQTTVGAAGGAAAPPASPNKYLKVKDSGGTILVIPAYAAS